MMLPPVVRDALAQIQREARAAGYAAGYADGEAAGREAERAALAAALLDAAAEVRRREGVASPPNTGAPGPSPAAEVGTPAMQTPPARAAGPADASPAMEVGAAVVPPLEDRRRVDADSVPPSGVPSPSRAAEAGPPSPPVPDAKLPSPAAPMVQAGADAGPGLVLRDAAGPFAPPSPTAPMGQPKAAAQRIGRARGHPWRTEAREVVVRARWRDAALSVAGLRAIVAAMPGDPVPEALSAIYKWGEDLGLGSRGRPTPAQLSALLTADAARGVEAAREAAGAEPEAPAEEAPAAEAEAPAPIATTPPAVEAASAPLATASTEGWQTEARRVLLEQHYPDGIPLSEIRALMGELPGATVPPGGVSAWAKALGLERPATAGALPPPNPKLERIPRTCLRCERKFTAEGRFERLCGFCRKASEGIAA